MLVGAGVRNGGGPMRQLGGPLAAAVDGNTWAPGGARRNWWAGQGTVIAGASIANKSGIPDGALHPASSLMPTKAGAMSSRYVAALLLNGAGTAVGGVTTTGSAALALSAPSATILPANDSPPARTASAAFVIAATAVGDLIATSTGTAPIALTGTGTMTGTVDSAGGAALSIAANSPTLGALADLFASASLSVAGAATALPSDDTPPARTASAALAITAALVPYAIGHMTGTTDVAAELTAGQVAAATVAALQATTIPVDIAKVNGLAVDGSGTSLDPWGPA